MNTGQKIVPKISQKREIKCERTENKSLQSIYTLARLASSSSRVRRTTVGSTGPTIMDFMQCINFKSRLDREREMIRRKIRSSTLYRKPSFSKTSGFNIYNVNGDISKTNNYKISKNIQKDDSLRKAPKSPLFFCDEQDDEQHDGENKGILEVFGSKYLDLTSNTTIVKSVSSSTLCLINNELDETKQPETDFEKAISQSHLSPFLKKHDDVELKATLSSEILSPSLKKRKDHNKIIVKKSTNLYAVGINVGKYSDAQKTEVVLDELPNSTLQKTQTPVAKAKKSGTKKKSPHSKKLETKDNSPKMTVTRKSEN